MTFHSNREKSKNHLEKAMQYCVQKKLEIVLLCVETNLKAGDIKSDVEVEKRIYPEWRKIFKI
jgi:hypothetical protein